ncbi:MAG TPA: hypothetical protein DIC35_03520 [Candidatus Moranbacteria bacterium]|nr:hypothetical protein [Candidatus Moranbacteria bacterium]
MANEFLCATIKSNQNIYKNINTKMASQISHIIYAKQLFDKLEKGELREGFFDNETIRKILTYKDDFLLGCVFPDVRLVAENLARKDTHMFFNQVNLDFRNLSPFQSGWKFHVYCDMKREEILNKYDFYEAIKNVENSWLANKMLEDELIYDVYNNWEKLVNFFNDIPRINLLEGLSRESLEFWYAIISKYIEKKPDNKTMHIFIIKSKQEIQKADLVVEKIEKLRRNAPAELILKKVFMEIV